MTGSSVRKIVRTAGNIFMMTYVAAMLLIVWYMFMIVIAVVKILGSIWLLTLGVYP